MKQAEIALARADEAQAYAAAYAVQTRKRELEMADCPCLEHYRKVMQARSHYAAAKRHEQVAVSAVTPQRKGKQLENHHHLHPPLMPALQGCQALVGP